MIVNNNQQSLSLNAFKLTVKNIGGKLFRVNENINIKQPDNSYQNKNDLSNKQNIREFKLVSNLQRRISTALSEDDATSDDDYSGNVSFLEEEDYQEKDTSFHRSMTIDDIEDVNISGMDLNDIDSYMQFSTSSSKSAYDKKNSYSNKNQSKTSIFKWTHFLSIPLYNNKEFIDKFDFFKKKIIEEDFSDIDESLFQKSNRLHLTICLFKIEEKSQKENFNLIKKLFLEAEEDIKNILEGNPLYIDFDQLEIMGTQTQTRVLYTRPNLNNSEKLKDIIDRLVNKFIENKIITEDMLQSSHIFYNKQSERYENEKLHVTLMNSTFMIREGLTGGNIKNINKGNELIKQDSQLFNKSFFNGMKIIKKMKNFSFGAHKIEELILNEMKIDNKTDTYKIQDTFKI